MGSGKIMEDHVIIVDQSNKNCRENSGEGF